MCFGHKAKPYQPDSKSEIKAQKKYEKEGARYARKQRELEKELKKQKKKNKKAYKRGRRHHYGLGIGNLGNLSPSYSPGVSL